MGILEKVGISAVVLALIAGGYWYLIRELNERAEHIGALEAEAQQLVVAVEHQRQDAQAARTELMMWRELYADLQLGFKELANQRQTMARQLAALREQSDVKEYLSCPMPDSLYDWVRKN